MSKGSAWILAPEDSIRGIPPGLEKLHSPRRVPKLRPRGTALPPLRSSSHTQMVP